MRVFRLLLYFIVLNWPWSLFSMPRALFHVDRYVPNPLEAEYKSYLLRDDGSSNMQPISLRAYSAIKKGLRLLHEEYNEYAERKFDIFSPELVEGIIKADQDLPPAYSTFYIGIYDYGMTRLQSFARVLVTKKHHFSNVDGKTQPRPGGTEIAGFEADYRKLSPRLQTVRYEIGRVWTLNDGAYRTDYLAEIYLAILQVIYHQNKRIIEAYLPENLEPYESVVGAAFHDHTVQNNGEPIFIHFNQMYKGIKDTGIYAAAGNVHARVYKSFDLGNFATAEELESDGIHIMGTDLAEANVFFLKPYKKAMELFKEGDLKALSSLCTSIRKSIRMPFLMLEGKLALMQNKFEKADSILSPLHEQHPEHLRLTLYNLIAKMGLERFDEAKKYGAILEKRLDELDVTREWNLRSWDRKFGLQVKYPNTAGMNQTDEIRNIIYLLEALNNLENLRSGDLFAGLKVKQLPDYWNLNRSESVEQLPISKELQKQILTIVDQELMEFFKNENLLKQSLNSIKTMISEVGLNQKDPGRPLSRKERILFVNLTAILKLFHKNFSGLAFSLTQMSDQDIQNLKPIALNQYQFFAYLLDMVYDCYVIRFGGYTVEEAYYLNQLEPRFLKNVIRKITQRGTIGSLRDFGGT